MIQIHPAQTPPVATVHLPGSKSYTNRALAVAALAHGRSTLHGALFSDDTDHMSAALNELGIRVEADPRGQTMTVEGCGGVVPSDAATLFCGNAGTAVRFLLALCALGHGRYVIDGNARMRERPQGPLLAALRQLGAEVTSQFGNDCPPVTLQAGGLHGGTLSMDGSLSSQYFTALCQVAPCMALGLDLRVEGDLVSKPYLDMTADVMAAFGVTMVNESYGRFIVAPGQAYQATDYHIEPDASGASYFLGAAAVTGGCITVRGLHRNSRQGDVAFADVLGQMGCTVTDSPDGLTVQGPAQLRGVSVDMNAVSDTALTLAAIAPFASTPTEIRGIEHARRQECDRVAAVATELARLGVRVEERPDGWRIEPGQPTGGSVETYDDHRMAMSFALIGLKTPGIQIRNPECVRKTFPSFWHRFAALTLPGLA
ncbi:MAG: 3-phosphoshikimate 1-carboxyvinyltransferase [Armatimonadetes bacterium]|nr:3-phosphoshikimate 1-carboxyvinyltransferase [Armatimonadota bacterium]